MSVRAFLLFGFSIAALFGDGHAGAVPEPVQPAVGAEIATNDNRSPAGQLRDGVLTLRLEARTGTWYRENRGSPSLTMQAFGEAGRAPQIPAPLIRVPIGTAIHLTVRNALDAPLVVHGLHGRFGETAGPLELAPGITREVRFRAAAEGTFYYWATTTGRRLRDRQGIESQLSGAFIGDAPGAPAPDRVFVIGWWSNPAANGERFERGRNAIVVNGRSWPYTERLTYSVGDSVRWRWINTSLGNHPMHLHGAYFQVESTGDGDHDNRLAAGQRRRVVTELMTPGSTMNMSWTPEGEGNWLFHCHVLPHIAPGLRLGATPSQQAHASGESQHALDGMAGLVLGLHILPAPLSAAHHGVTGESRRLRLVAQAQPGRYGTEAGFAFALHEQGDNGPGAAAQVPGPPIVLIKDQPVEITVVNQLTEPTTVHWHAMELESYYDGIAGWSGTPGHIAPMIMPGSSFVARFTPRRAGTLIYHTHVDDVRQLSSGLYGPLIVVERGASLDPATDRIMLLSVQGPLDNSPIMLNGQRQPAAIELHAGLTYRFRFINITPHDPLLTVSLLSGAEPVQWRALAKDGAELPEAQAIVRAARQTVSVGETYDFELKPAIAGELSFEIFRPGRTLVKEERITVPVHVRRANPG